MTDPMRAHYRTLLAPIYRWLLGDPESALARSRAELASLGIGPARSGARALDLGAGTGLQSIPLTELGYEVTAIDVSTELLAELRAACPGAITLEGDIREFATLASGEFDVIVCMGDTLTHLPSKIAVESVLTAACRKLAPGGTLALTLRDYASHALQGNDRFIFVRGDSERVLTCFLDYTAESVQVTDILHERTAAGWEMRKSSYPKLRLSLEWLTEKITACGCVATKAARDCARIRVTARPH